MRKCGYSGCENSFNNHRWGNIKAHDEGWVLLKNGDAWCPEHTPAWVSQWRDNKSK